MSVDLGNLSPKIAIVIALIGAVALILSAFIQIYPALTQNDENGGENGVIETAVAATQTALPKYNLLDFEDSAGWEIKQEGPDYAVIASAKPCVIDEVIFDGQVALKAELNLELNEEHQARFFLTKRFPPGHFQADRIVIHFFWPESQDPTLTYALICINTPELSQHCEELQDFNVKRWNSFDVDLTSVPFRDTYYSGYSPANVGHNSIRANFPVPELRNQAQIKQFECQCHYSGPF